MKTVILRKMPKTLDQFMRAKGLTPKELAQKAKISYTSLMPILNGTRECSISKLIVLAKALGCTPNALLKDLYSPVDEQARYQSSMVEPRFLMVFISVVKVTYCLFYDTQTNKTLDSVQQFPLRCGDEPEFFIDSIMSAIEKFSQEFKGQVELKDIAVFASVQQYGRKANREKIQSKCDHLFSKFIMESDAVSNHHAFVGLNNGICISINDGCVITYSLDNGQTIDRLQGYGFPISDTGGNYWIGCEAIKHVVSVKERREPSSVLSDQLLALYNDDLIYLCASASEVPHITYLKASALVKELITYHEAAYKIIQKSVNLLLADITMIEAKLPKTKLPIYVSGELAHLYDAHFPKGRLTHINESQKTVLLKYGLEKLKA